MNENMNENINEERIKKVNDRLFPCRTQTEADNNIVFVYTPPKVGSTCLVTSIRLSAAHKFSILHIHDEIMLTFFVKEGEGVTVNEIIQYNQRIGKNVYVIDVYRSPIERKFSEYFEKIAVHHFNNTEENINKYSVKRVMDRFDKLFPYLGVGDHYAEKFGFNIQSFDHTCKYDYRLANGVRYIKLRLMDSKDWGPILTYILKTKITIVSDYETTNKRIGDLYKRFKQEYTIPNNFFEMIEKDPYLTLYYSFQERKQYLDDWSKKKRNYDGTFFTPAEYKLYVDICLENQHLDDVQFEHYIDNGCLCTHCSSKRKEVLHNFLNGQIKDREKMKIVHNDLCMQAKTEKLKQMYKNSNNTHDIIKSKPREGVFRKMKELNLTWRKGGNML